MNELVLNLDGLLPPPSRGRRAKVVQANWVRPLEPADILALQNRDIGSETRPLLKIKHQHHTLARLVAEGRPDHEISSITLYSPSYICNIKRDPMFQETVAYYKAQVDAAYLNIHEALASVGVMALEELKTRLEDAPEQFSAAQVLAVMGATLDRAGYGPTSKQVVTNVSVSVQQILDEVKTQIDRRRSGTVQEIASGGERTRILQLAPLPAEHDPEGTSAARVESEGPAV